MTITRRGRRATPLDIGPDAEAKAPRDNPKSLEEALLAGTLPVREGLSSRIQVLLEALGTTTAPFDVAGLVSSLDTALAGAGAEEAWLALAVLTGTLPETADVLRLARSMRLDGPRTGLFRVLEESGLLGAEDWPPVEIATGTVVIDVHHTSRTPLVTGIQRVARQTIGRWTRDHDVLFTGWTKRYRAYRRLTDAEVDWALRGPVSTRDENAELFVSGTYGGIDPNRDPREGVDEDESEQAILVPWRCTHVVPELPAEFERAGRYQAMAAFSRSATGLIGFDCVPLTAAETCADGMAIGFAKYLAAAANVDRLAAISEAAAGEYGGWRAMLAGSGRAGPEIRAVPLPVEPTEPSPDVLERARRLVSIGTLPVVLAVGSHEPRKNHLAVLDAAETLWREGLEFTLTFIGGNSWKSDAFTAQVETLQASRRPVQTLLALPDVLLWGAYRAAYCSVFVSLHEGFGLPVAESLASGTPVVTSNFGSMRDLASHGGALLVDPHDGEAITDALRRLLHNPSLRAELAAETSRLPPRTWDDYAREVWEFLVERAPQAESDTELPDRPPPS